MDDSAEKYLEPELPEFIQDSATQGSVPLMENKKKHLRIACVHGKTTKILQVTVYTSRGHKLRFFAGYEHQ